MTVKKERGLVIDGDRRVEFLRKGWAWLAGFPLLPERLNSDDFPSLLIMNSGEISM